MQRKAGNAAVSEWLGRDNGGHLPAEGRLRPDLLAVQRCGAIPCDCPPEERAEERDGRSAAASGTVVQRACGPTAIGKRDKCVMTTEDVSTKVLASLALFVANPFLFDFDCDTMAAGQADRMRKDVKKGERVKIHGFASEEGEPRYNKFLSCARAEAAAQFLTDEVGAVVTDVFAHGALPGPRVPRRGVVVEHEQPPKPKPEPEGPTDVCGPDVDAQLTAVLTHIQDYFRDLSGWHKHRSCQQLISPGAGMAWDIEQLYLPNTVWLRAPPFASKMHPCSQPHHEPNQDIEDPNHCGNTVRVGGKCNLAGTVNYAAFGIMMRECHDWYDHFAWYNVFLKLNVGWFTGDMMRFYIRAYKFLGDDDYHPPTEFAEAAYEDGPIHRPSTENRAHCHAPCEATEQPPPLTFIWEPYQSR